VFAVQRGSAKLGYFDAFLLGFWNGKSSGKATIRKTMRLELPGIRA
jgi:hypothetical protein